MKDDLRREYKRSDFGEMVRGRYAARYRESANIALIEPALHRLFPDSAAVNRALREYAEEHDLPLVIGNDATSCRPGN